MKALTVLSWTMAVIGMFWGLFCLPWTLAGLASGGAPLLTLMMLAGYVITAGYVALSICDLPLWLARTIWGVSALVQGGWLLWFVLGAAGHEWSMSFFQFCLAWWTFAFIASVIGLITERRGRNIDKISLHL